MASVEQLELKDLEWQQDIPGGVRCETSTVGLHFASTLGSTPVTVHMPGAPKNREALYLTQPTEIRSRMELDPDAWGFQSPQPPTIASIKRIGFSAMVSDLQLVGNEMNSWVDNFVSWLDLFTGQHLTTVGYRPPRQAMNRTCLWVRHSDGSIQPEWVYRPFPTVYSLTQLDATAEMLKLSCALAGENEQVPLAWTLLRDARALHRVAQTRRAAIECGSAAEMAIKSLLDARSVAMAQKKPTLGPLSDALRDDGYPLQADFEASFLDVRNREVHLKPGWGVVSEAESKRMLEIAAELVEDAFALPHGMKRIW